MTDHTPTETSAAPDQPRPRRGLIFLALATATLEVAAAAGLLILMGPPSGVSADDLRIVEPSAESWTVEVPILAERLQNNRGGVTHVYDVEVVVTVRQADAARIQAQLDRCGHECRAAIVHLWRSADPAQLDEPDLRTITRRLQAWMVDRFGRDSVTGAPIVTDVIVISGTGFRAE
jgi:hypothetical protein